MKEEFRVLNQAEGEPSWRITTVKRKATTRVTGETGYVAELSFYLNAKRVACSFRHVVFNLLLVFPSISGRASYRWETWTYRDLLLDTYRQWLQSLAGQCEPCWRSVARSACTFFPRSLQVQKCDFLKITIHALLYTPKSSKG